MATSQHIAERAIALLGEESEAAKRLRARFPVMLRDAMTRVSELVAASDDPSLRNLLRKTYTVEVEGGVGDFAAALADAEPPLLDFFRRAEVRFAAADDAKADAASTWLPSVAALRQSWPQGYYYHALEGAQVSFRGPDGALGSVTGEAEVTSNYLLTDVTTVTHRQIETLIAMELVAAAAPPVPAKK